eukprot:TRINITY_DN22401_c0_g1_i1.p1 TRINITY_DN22401_c0_g1~~TRINITY_DN22401_c0_g1_i1.p1  ORF type:complete len:178 (-),score=32.92 TRINITY_DN22401_c0_g1_i1:513-1046(-)
MCIRDSINAEYGEGSPRNVRMDESTLDAVLNWEWALLQALLRFAGRCIHSLVYQLPGSPLLWMSTLAVLAVTSVVYGTRQLASWWTELWVSDTSKDPPFDETAPAPLDSTETTTPPAPAVASADCSVCLESPADGLLVFVPCGHRCVCGTCAAQIRRRSSKCPICRARFSTTVRVWD